MKTMSCLTILPLLLALSSSLAAQDVTHGPPSQQDLQEVPPTRFRVLREDGRAAAGATVVAVSAPEPDNSHARPFDLREARTDERGSVKMQLEEGRLWAVWACYDEGKHRFATDIEEDVQPGRGGLLRLRPFPVPFVRIVGVDAWRQAVPGPLALRFTSEGRFGVHFAAELPAGDDPIVRLPPLPLRNYFPTLLDAHGRPLDFTYFSPEFHEGDADVEPLYERDHPLKRVVLGKPVAHEYRIVDSEDKPVSGARMHLSYSLPLETGGVFESDDEGRIQLMLPFRPEGVRARYEAACFVWAPGLWPLQRGLEVHEKAPGEPELLRLEKHGRPLELGLDRLGRALEPSTRFYVSSRWQHGRTIVSAPYPLEIPRGPKGMLQMPALPLGKTIFDVWAADATKLRPLFCGTASELLQLAGELPEAAPAIELRVRRAGGGRPLGARVTVLREGNHRSDEESQGFRGFERALDSRGQGQVRLPAGDWWLYARSPRDGDCALRIEVSPGKAPQVFELELARFRQLAGRVRDTDDKPIAGVDVTVQLQGFNVPHAALVQLLQQRPVAGKTDARGQFRVPVSTLADRLMVWCSHQVDGQYLHATQSVDWSQGPVGQLDLQLSN